MEFDALLAMLAGMIPYGKLVLSVLGGLVVLGLVYVKLSPSPADDAFVAKLEKLPILGHLLKALVKFSPISRKE